MTNILHDLKGEDKNQFLTLCDKKGRIKGIATRDECHLGDGKPHLAFMALIFDKNGKLILGRRNPVKTLWGGAWDATAVSHVLPKETVEQAANRRGKEEFGVNVVFRNIGGFYYFARQDKRSENEYCYVLVGRTSEKIDPNPVEVSEIDKVNPQSLKKDLEKNPDKYTPWLRIAFEKFAPKIKI